MSIEKTIPISIADQGQLAEAVDTACRAVENFLEQFYVKEFILKERSSHAIVGRWLSMMPGREKDHADDVSSFAQDLMLQIQVGETRSLISDAMSLYLGGVMPSYTRAKILAGMLADRRPAVEVEAFFHDIGYGSVKAFIDEQGPKSRQQAIKQWRLFIKVLQDEVRHLETEVEKQSTIMVAQAMPNPAPNQPVTDVPVNDPVYRTPPNLRLVPRVPGSPAPASRAALFAEGILADIAVGVVLFLIPGNAFQKNTEDEDMRKIQAQYAKQKLVPIPQQVTQTTIAPDSTKNECQSQMKENQKNGAACENDGYVILEESLFYKRLIDPPKGKGLDGLFEKDAAHAADPKPMPSTVTSPSPGKLIFIPPDKRPPNACYDYETQSNSIYPKFVVFEAKNIAKSFNPNDTAGIQKEAEGRLGDTCDGTQMGTKWTEKRIPQALEKDRKETGKSKKDVNEKRDEIDDYGYARWMFVCLPAPIGEVGKLYVFIDVVESGMDVESGKPKPRKSRKPTQSSPSTDQSGGY